MAQSLQTRHVLPMLRGRGLRVHRESLADMSDLLGLQTRMRAANEVSRAWSPAQVELIALAFTLRQRWLLGDDDLRQLAVPHDGERYGAEIVGQLAALLADFAQLASGEAEAEAEEAAEPAQRTTAA